MPKPEIARRKDVHTSFGLSYSNYLVVERTLLQSMPPDWQHQFVTLMDQLNAAFRHVERSECFDVTPGVEREVGELTATEMQALGVTPPEPFTGDEDDEDAYLNWLIDAKWLYRGEEYGSEERIVFPVADPVPHYNRGRAYVEPRFPDPTD